MKDSCEEWEAVRILVRGSGRVDYRWWTNATGGCRLKKFMDGRDRPVT